MPKFDDSGWAEVLVPHDWAVALPFAPGPVAKGSDRGAAHGFKAIGRDFPENSIGWYRTPIAITAADRGRQHLARVRRRLPRLPGIRERLCRRPQRERLRAVRVDIGDFLDYDGGPNVITVRADASLGEGWFYEGAGIYRHVDLVSADPLHIPQWGTVVRSDVGADGALVRVATDVRNSASAPSPLGTLRQSLIGPDGKVAVDIAGCRARFRARRAAHDRAGDFAQDAAAVVARRRATSIAYDPKSGRSTGWSTAVDTRFGIRTIAFDPERGFFLNGAPVKLLGTANHHDHAGVGTGIPDALHRWRVAQLKEMGSNAWRSAHNPPASALLDACDELGMLMIDEQRYNSSDPESVSQLERIVRRDRNHPSVILWSLGNEEPHQATERGARINAELKEHVQRLDPTRPTTFAMDQGWDNGVGRVVDVLGFNYRTNQIEAYHHRHPEQPVIGTETGSTVATRGEYANDPARHIVRAYDTEHPWWATTAEEWWTIVADRPYIAGGFVWTGFDYRGEPTPFDTLPSISSQFGILDTCGFPKDNYYYYRAWWRPDRPLVHLLPHWNWPGREGQPIEVWAHGNTEEVELQAQRPFARAQGDAAQPPPRMARALCAGAAGGDRIQWRSRGRARRARDQPARRMRCG